LKTNKQAYVSVSDTAYENNEKK